MSIYDTLLANQQQGLQTQNANQMQIAQMPTFADKFLAGLRGGQDQAFKQQTTLSNMEMNRAYKEAQEQSMRDNRANQLLQRQTGLLSAASNSMTPLDREGWAALGAQHGIPSSAFPQQQFETTTVPGEEAINPMTGMPETSSNTQEQTPIGNTGYGGHLQYLRDMMDQKWDVANLSANSKMLMLQYKGMEPKSALGKLNADYARLKGTPAEISDQDYSAMRSKLETLVNPLAAPWLGQGYVASATLNRPGTALPGPSGSVQAQPGVPQAAGHGGNLGGGTKPSNTPNLPGSGAPAPYIPGPMTPKTAMAAEQDKEKVSGAITTLDNLTANLDKAISHPGADSGAYIPTLGVRGRSLDPQGLAFDNLLESIRSGEIINQLQALKANGVGLGRVTQMEWNGLGNLISSLDTHQDKKTLIQNLMQIKGIVDQIKTKLLAGADATAQARGLTPQQGQPGEIQIDSNKQKWRWSGVGDYNDQKTWTKVQ